MNKLKMQTPNLTAQNIDKIAALFPNCITEMLDEEKSTPDHKVYKHGINFELLKQMLSPDVVDGDEAYEFTWVGKKASIVEANKPIRKTLRPCPEESKNWDDTENLYIEGDNLEVLKLLQESYLGKVKMIYIDPPYNTGNDFIYADDFMRSQDEENRQMGMYDEDENRLFKNNDSNGRFHSDWCSMMYSRLMLARNLLTDDGLILISLDDGEIGNLRKICDEIFGESNFVTQFVWKSRQNKDNRNLNGVSVDHEYILAYSKLSGVRIFKGEERSGEGYSNPDNDPNGAWASANMAGIATESQRPNLHYDLINPATGINYGRPKMGWRYDRKTMAKLIAENKILWPDSPSGRPRKKTYLNELSGNLPGFSSVVGENLFTRSGTVEIDSLFEQRIFNFPKPSELIKCFVSQITAPSDIILDFFSGSATSAHAVMRLNAEDSGHRKFIMVQLPEPCDEKSEAYKAGYKTICDIGKERIRRAGDKLYETLKTGGKDFQHIAKNINIAPRKTFASDDGQTSFEVPMIPARLGKADETAENQKLADSLDIGFRVFKLDDTNMKDVYYSAEEYSQTNLEDLESNIKEDRTDLDLLFGCLLDWGLPLSMPYRSEKIGNCTVHTYAPGDAALNVPDALVACFDNNVPENVIKEIAKRKPRRAVFRDSSFASSPEKINVFEIFKLYAQDTDVKVI
jgi:adenine-specific DNA-methyltransferase